MSHLRDLFIAKNLMYASPMDIIKNPSLYYLIDVRNGDPINWPSPDRITGARAMPLDELVAQTRDFIDSLPQDKTIVVYCWNTWCSLAVKAILVMLLEEDGLDVRELHGGIAAWKEMKFPVEG
jgi:rhodanese-related sulfurtransferase